MKIRSKLFYLFIALAIIYAAVNLLAAPPRASLDHYHVSSATLRLLNFSVIGPVIIVWFIGLFGFQKLRTYSGLISGNPDGKHVAELCRGILLLALWLPLNSTISSVLSLIGQHHHGLMPAITVVVNYFGLLLPLVGFLYISKGSRGMSELVKQRPSWRAMNSMAMLLVLVGVAYSYAVANAHATLGATYHMPVALVLLTIVVPYIYSWYLGLFAAYELHQYSFKVQGIIYRRSWNQLAFGITWIILFSMVLQFVTVVTAKLANLPLGSVLLLLYGVILVLAVGYIFMAVGAKRLTRIEEV